MRQMRQLRRSDPSDGLRTLLSANGETFGIRSPYRRN